MLSLGNVNMNKLHGSWHVNKALYFVKTLSIHRCGKQKLCFTKLSRTISKLRECPQAHIRLGTILCLVPSRICAWGHSRSLGPYCASFFF